MRERNGPSRVCETVAAVVIGLSACGASALAQGASMDDPAPPAETSATSATEPQNQTGSQAGTQGEGQTESQPESQPGSQPETQPSSQPESAAPASAPLATIPVEAAPAAAPAKDAQQLETVVVTATKREKSLREIAGSIGEFNGAKLETEGKFNLQDFIEQKPGVTMTTLGPHMVRVNIRGIGSDAYAGSPLPSPTGMLIGDTAFGDPFIANIQPDMSAFDLSRVEVLKGPQGTLFGGAALAGAVRYVLQDPVPGEWQARSFSQYDAPNGGSTALSEGAALNAPLWGDSLTARLAYVNRHYPGITDSTSSQRNRIDTDKSTGNQLRGILSWRPLDALGLKLTHLSQKSDTPDAVSFADNKDGPRETDKKILPQPSYGSFGLDSLEADYDFDTWRVVALTSRTEKHWWVNVDISYVITGPPDANTDPNSGTFQITDDKTDSVSQELRLQSTGKDGLQWLAGLYNADYKVFFEILDDTVANARTNQQAGTDPAVYHESTLLYAVTNVKAYERAGFADLSYKFWDKLELSAGARYYQTEVLGGFLGTGALARDQNNGQAIDFSGNKLNEKGLSPKFTATYTFTPDVSSYLLASRGFRFGGIQTVPSSPCNTSPPNPNCNGVPPDYKSDTIWNYEFGVRTSWFDNTLHFDPTLFYIDYNKPQVVLRTNNPSGLNLAYTDNVDHAIAQGFEGALEWLTPLDGVKFDLSGGYTDSHITTPIQVPSPYVSGGCGCTVIQPGAKMPGVARYQYLAAIGYTAPQIGIFNIAGRVDYNYIGPGVGTLLQERPINNYGTLNAGITLTTSLWRLKPVLSFNVANIMDTTAVKLGYTVKPVPGGLVDVWYLNQPRTYSARIGLDF